MSAVRYGKRFEQLWSQVWRHDAKYAAWMFEWQGMDEEDKERALAAVESHADYYSERPLDKRPYLRTWLKERRYEDEVVVADTRQAAWQEMGWGGLVQGG